MGVVFGSCLLVTAQQREFDNARNTLIADQFNNPVIEVDHKAPGLPAPDGAQKEDTLKSLHIADIVREAI